MSTPSYNQFAPNGSRNGAADGPPRGPMPPYHYPQAPPPHMMPGYPPQPYFSPHMPHVHGSMPYPEMPPMAMDHGGMWGPPPGYGSVPPGYGMATGYPGPGYPPPHMMRPHFGGKMPYRDGMHPKYQPSQPSIPATEIRAIARLVVHASIARGQIPVFGKDALKLLPEAGKDQDIAESITSRWITVLKQNNMKVVAGRSTRRTSRRNADATPMHQLNVKISEFWSYKAKRLKKDLEKCDLKDRQKLEPSDLENPEVVRALVTWSNVPVKDLTQDMVALGVWRGNKLLAGQTLRNDIQVHRSSGSQQRRHSEFTKARSTWVEEIAQVKEEMFPGGSQAALDEGIAKLLASPVALASPLVDYTPDNSVSDSPTSWGPPKGSSSPDPPYISGKHHRDSAPYGGPVSVAPVPHYPPPYSMPQYPRPIPGAPGSMSSQSTGPPPYGNYPAPGSHSVKPPTTTAPKSSGAMPASTQW